MPVAKHIGATVIGVVSNEEKAALARAHGAAHNVIGHATLVQEVKRIIGGAIVPAVYDTVRKDTFNASLDSLAPAGSEVRGLALLVRRRHSWHEERKSQPPGADGCRREIRLDPDERRSRRPGRSTEGIGLGLRRRPARLRL